MNIQIPQIIFQIINFSVVAGALTYLLYKPILKILNDRSEKIAEGQRAAEKNLKDREELQAERERELEKARKEAHKIIAQAQDLIKAQKSQVQKEAKEEAEKIIRKLETKWHDDRKKQEAQMRKEFSEAVILVTEKIVGNLDSKTKSKLLDKEIKEILEKI